MRCIIPLVFPPAAVVPQPDSPTFSHLRLHLVFPPSFFVALASPPRPPHSLSLSFRLARYVRQSGTVAPPPESATSVGFSVAATTDDYTVNACEKQVQAKHEQKMFSCIKLGVLLGTLLIITNIPDAASYSKYGRTCKDIGCRSDEVCVMAEDPCGFGNADQCGRYPTCQKTSGASCTSMVCGQNEYCKSENGSPRCVRKSTGPGYESAGVSYVNGERVDGNNANPYANANAPPPPPQSDPSGGYHRTSAGNNLGYPPYPSNTGSSASGYPSYPQSTNQADRHRDLGYPPYPTQNRMPMPGQPAAYPGYPQQTGYPQNYPGQQSHPGQQNYPGYYPNQNYPNQNYPNQNQQRGYGYNSNSINRRNGADRGALASTILVGLAGLLLLAV